MAVLLLKGPIQPRGKRNLIDGFVWWRVRNGRDRCLLCRTRDTITSASDTTEAQSRRARCLYIQMCIPDRSNTIEICLQIRKYMDTLGRICIAHIPSSACQRSWNEKRPIQCACNRDSKSVAYCLPERLRDSRCYSRSNLATPQWNSRSHEFHKF